MLNRSNIRRMVCCLMLLSAGTVCSQQAQHIALTEGWRQRDLETFSGTMPVHVPAHGVTLLQASAKGNGAMLQRPMICRIFTITSILSPGSPESGGTTTVFPYLMKM